MILCESTIVKFCVYVTVCKYSEIETVLMKKHFHKRTIDGENVDVSISIAT
jgi:hypothetical protein